VGREVVRLRKPARDAVLILKGPESLTPCLQSDVYACCGRADLVGGLSVSSREVPQLTPVNDADLDR
jgi:hypothetical protein